MANLFSLFSGRNARDNNSNTTPSTVQRDALPQSPSPARRKECGGGRERDASTDSQASDKSNDQKHEHKRHRFGEYTPAPDDPKEEIPISDPHTFTSSNKASFEHFSDVDGTLSLTPTRRIIHGPSGPTNERSPGSIPSNLTGGTVPGISQLRENQQTFVDLSHVDDEFTAAGKRIRQLRPSTAIGAHLPKRNIIKTEGKNKERQGNQDDAPEASIPRLESFGSPTSAEIPIKQDPDEEAETQRDVEATGAGNRLKERILTKEIPQTLYLPVQPWKKQSELPPIPVWRKRNNTFATRYVGTLNKNMRVKLPELERTKRRIWIANPTDDEAVDNRRRGDPVWSRVVFDRLQASVAFEYIDLDFQFVSPEAVDIDPSIKLRKLQRDSSKAYLKKYNARIMAYKRDMALFLARMQLFISWHPSRDAYVTGIPSRELQIDAALTALKKQKIEMDEWSVASLERENSVAISSHRRELERHSDTLQKMNLGTAEELVEAIESSEEWQNFHEEDIFKSSVDDTINTLRSDFILSVGGTDVKWKAAAAIYSGKFDGKTVKAPLLVALCLILGWSRADLVVHHPGCVSKVAKFFW